MVVDHYSEACEPRSPDELRPSVLVTIWWRRQEEFDVFGDHPHRPKRASIPASKDMLPRLDFLAIRSTFRRVILPILHAFSSEPAGAQVAERGASELPGDFEGEHFGGVAGLVPDEWERIDGNDPWPAIARQRRLVTAAGSTLWEAARVGIPVVVVLVAENQRLNFEWAREQGIPCLNASAHTGKPSALAERLMELLPQALPLRAVENGSGRVRDAILELLKQAA